MIGLRWQADQGTRGRDEIVRGGFGAFFWIDNEGEVGSTFVFLMVVGAGQRANGGASSG